MVSSAGIILAMTSTEHQIATLLKDIRPSLRLAMLFGSMAEGRERFDSDMDLGLLDAEPLDADTIFEIGQSIVEKIGWPADIVGLHDVPQPITGIALQGKRLFGSDECFASLCTRHLIEREGFGRVRERELDKRIEEWNRQPSEKSSTYASSTLHALAIWASSDRSPRRPDSTQGG